MSEDFRNRFKPRAYAFHMMLGFAAYAALLAASILVLQRRLAPEGWALIVALLPMLAVPYIALTILRFYARLDELQRRIQGEAFVAAAILTAFGAMSFGFAANAGVAQPSLIWVLPAMVGLWGVLGFLFRFRYR